MRGFKCRPHNALGSLFQKTLALNEEWVDQTDGKNIQVLMQADEAFSIAQTVEAVFHEPDAKEGRIQK